MAGSTRSRREVSAGLVGLAASAALPGRLQGESRIPADRRDVSITVDARPEPLTIALNETALLVVDMQNDFGSRGGMFDRAGIDISGIRAVIPAIRNVLAAARQNGLPVFYLKMGFRPDLSDAGAADGSNMRKHAPLHAGAAIIAPNGRPSRILIRDTWNTDIIPELPPQPGEVIIYKSRFSGFYNTDLHENLQGRHIRNLIIAGCTTSVCVESTVRDAMFRDYRCLVMEDCTAEPIGAQAARSNHEASLLTMQILFAWISNSHSLNLALQSG
jgi:ureidoacrylate peracid hydrolase